ncbi:ATP-binding protein [Marinomonas ostreistagni]|uniref:ATP-binding protein n=1 Tax=Marinomonas ostreistagni TaxID=359209 RepID=UPI00194EA53D|nr:ATP-binding protein [Marinomonas ostreistagni]MBM6550309.1 AAA family ATPase [Marinomonas ostreistagni]
MKKIVFIAGIHGVGKTTFCQKIQEDMAIKHYSCSTLIKENSDYIETSKTIDKAERNQLILIEALNRIPDEKLLLDGHFCLIDNSNSVLKLDDSVFESLNLSAIAVLTCDINTIHNRLQERDGTTFDIKLLQQLHDAELEMAIRISSKLNIPLIHYRNGILMKDSPPITDFL